MTSKIDPVVVDYLAKKWFSVPVKVRLFLGMLFAANTAALAIYMALNLAGFESEYMACLGTFLAARVYLFMANKQMPLNDENVAFMSSERWLWNLATIAVLMAMYLVRWLITFLS